MYLYEVASIRCQSLETERLYSYLLPIKVIVKQYLNFKSCK
jgi:hypothetical protein